MPVTIDLIHNDHVLFYVYQFPWQMADLDAIRPLEQNYFDTTPYPRLHSIVDATHVGTPPVGILRGREMTIITHPKSGCIAVVGAPAIAKTLTDVIIRVSHISNNRFTYHKTVADARAFLDKVIEDEKERAN